SPGGPQRGDHGEVSQLSQVARSPKPKLDLRVGGWLLAKPSPYFADLGELSPSGPARLTHEAVGPDHAALHRAQQTRGRHGADHRAPIGHEPRRPHAAGAFVGARAASVVRTRGKAVVGTR